MENNFDIPIQEKLIRSDCKRRKTNLTHYVKVN